MKKYIAIGLLSILFAAICLLVIISKGNPRYIKYKLKIGASIIALTAVLSTGCPDNTVYCYSGITPTSSITINNQTGYYQYVKNIYVDFESENYVLKCDFDNESKISAVSYQIFDKNENIIQRGDLDASDGAFDSYNEKFDIVLDSKKFSCGTNDYKLEIYDTSLDDINSAKIFEFTLKVSKLKK